MSMPTNLMVIGRRGTIESLWEANMEYISPENALDSRNRQWKIYSRNLISPPNFLGANAHVEDSLVVDGCFVDGTVKHSILSTGAQVREGAEVLDSVIMSGAIIGHGAKIKRAIIGEVQLFLMVSKLMEQKKYKL